MQAAELAAQLGELKPAGDKLQASGSFKVGPGTQGVAVISIAGEPAGTVRLALK